MSTVYRCAIVEKSKVPWQVRVIWAWSRADKQSMEMQSGLLYEDVILTDHCIEIEIQFTYSCLTILKIVIEHFNSRCWM